MLARPALLYASSSLPKKPKLLAWKNKFFSQKQRNQSPCPSPFLLGGSFGSLSWKIMRCEIQSPGAPLLRTKGVLGIQSCSTEIGDKRTHTLSDTKKNRDRTTKSGGS
jgi:hypothetical protein